LWRLRRLSSRLLRLIFQPRGEPPETEFAQRYIQCAAVGDFAGTGLAGGRFPSGARGGAEVLRAKRVGRRGGTLDSSARLGKSLQGVSRKWGIISRSFAFAIYRGPRKSHAATGELGLSMSKQHFYFKLIPPRVTFGADMTAEERALMMEHVRYTREAFDAGKVLIYGPVMASAGAFGVAVLEMEDASEVQRFGDEDPSIKAGMNRFEFCPMKIGAARGLA
jgi:uncharacterized protein